MGITFTNVSFCIKHKMKFIVFILAAFAVAKIETVLEPIIYNLPLNVSCCCISQTVM